MSVNASVRIGGAFVETLDLVYAGNSTGISHALINKQFSFSASSSPVGDTPWTGKITLSSGAGTIDLTALTRTNQDDLDLTGKKVIWVAFENTGAAAMTITEGGSNPFLIFGTSGSLTIPAGQAMEMTFGTGLADVSGTVCEIDIAGTGSQILNVMLLAGTQS